MDIHHPIMIIIAQVHQITVIIIDQKQNIIVKQENQEEIDIIEDGEEINHHQIETCNKHSQSR